MSAFRDSEDFIGSRSDWMKDVIVVRAEDGWSGVAVLIDGWYTDDRVAEEIAQWFREELAPIIAKAKERCDARADL